VEQRLDEGAVSVRSMDGMRQDWWLQKYGGFVGITTLTLQNVTVFRVPVC